MVRQCDKHFQSGNYFKTFIRSLEEYNVLKTEADTFSFIFVTVFELSNLDN